MRSSFSESLATHPLCRSSGFYPLLFFHQATLKASFNLKGWAKQPGAWKNHTIIYKQRAANIFDGRDFHPPRHVNKRVFICTHTNSTLQAKIKASAAKRKYLSKPRILDMLQRLIWQIKLPQCSIYRVLQLVDYILSLFEFLGLTFAD